MSHLQAKSLICAYLRFLFSFLSSLLQQVGTVHCERSHGVSLQKSLLS